VDVFSKHKRSAVMSRIRGRGNKSTERRMAAILRSQGISGWTLHPRAVEGKPDIYFPMLRIAIFLDGCFWHGCPTCFHAPRQNAPFWAAKIGRNCKRDQKVTRRLRRQGVKVIRLWEHDLEKRTRRVRTVLELLHTANRSSA